MAAAGTRTGSPSMRHGIVCTGGDQGLTEPSHICIGNCDADHGRPEMESEKAMVIHRFSRKEAYSRYFGISDRRLDLIEHQMIHPYAKCMDGPISPIIRRPVSNRRPEKRRQAPPNGKGCPIAIEVFEGNTGDPSTLGNQIAKLKERFGLKRVVMVGDRGMITQARIEGDLKPAGLDWITALRAPSIQQLAAEGGPLQLSLFDERDLAEIESADFPGERLIVCKNPALAEERKRKRDELLDATEQDLKDIQARIVRKRKPLRGADKIGLAVGALLGRRKVAKHFRIAIADASLSFARDHAAIATEAALDGFYVLRTNVPANTLKAADTVRAYKSLAGVERAFRSLKTVDLDIRPIFHWVSPRVRAHVFLCMLAYHLEWHMRQALAPILFDDHDRAAAEALRTSPVAKAKPSLAAKRKAKTKRTDDGLPVHSFRTLLADLATLTRNTVRWAKAPAMALLATPTQIQQRAFDLLGVKLQL